MNRYKQYMSLAALALVVACGGEKAQSGAVASHEPAAPVTGVEWRVESLTADGTTRHAPASARLRIDDGKAAGNLGCNQFSASATVHGDKITLGDLRTTRMACDPARMAFERAFARTLTTGTLTAVADHGKLTITTGNGDRVDLTRHGAA
jgi:heat shock protein HslJ